MMGLYCPHAACSPYGAGTGYRIIPPASPSDGTNAEVPPNDTT